MCQYFLRGLEYGGAGVLSLREDNFPGKGDD